MIKILSIFIFCLLITIFALIASWTNARSEYSNEYISSCHAKDGVAIRLNSRARGFPRYVCLKNSAVVMMEELDDD